MKLTNWNKTFHLSFSNSKIAISRQACNSWLIRFSRGTIFNNFSITWRKIAFFEFENDKWYFFELFFESSWRREKREKVTKKTTLFAASIKKMVKFTYSREIQDFWVFRWFFVFKTKLVSFSIDCLFFWYW